jgi:hypothetical protein
MDRATKSAIKKLVLGLRHLLEDDIEVVLKRYGLFIDRTWLSVEKIPKADEAILTARRRFHHSLGTPPINILTMIYLLCRLKNSIPEGHEVTQRKF